MSDENPSTPLPVVDRPLQRRVAWGLLAGRSKAEIASAEGISDDELNAALTGPCMFMLVNIWGVFFKEGDRGDMPLLRLLVRWALDFVLENSDRVQGAGIAKTFLIRASFKLGLNSTLKLLCDHIEGVIGIQDKQTPLRGVRGRLAQVMSWAIEIALMQLFIYQMGDEEIFRRDEYFREQILLQEFDAYSVDVYEMPAGAEPPLAEPVAATPVSEPVATTASRAKPTLVRSRPEEVPEGEASSVVGAESDPPLAAASAVIEPAPTMAKESAVPLDVAALSDSRMVGPSPAKTVESSTGSCLDLPCPRLVHSMPDVEAVPRPPIGRNVLYDSVRFKRRRRSSPLLVRHLPIGRAA